jgi:hypothetical protein
MAAQSIYAISRMPHQTLLLRSVSAGMLALTAPIFDSIMQIIPIYL